MIDLSTCIAGAGLLGWGYLAVFHGRFWQPLLFKSFAPSPAPKSWPSVDIIVPARDETESLPRSLPSLLAQDYPGAWRVILVDDNSSDGTATLAHKIAGERHAPERLTVIGAPELLKGWSGKVAAMQAGVGQSSADYILFTDADIWHPADNLKRLMARASANNLDLLSLMVRLHCATVAENLLIPAFIFFFAMLYPFRRANDPNSSVAAAAGGVTLVRRRTLDNCGGLKAIKSALIDDCALAHAIKFNGGEAAGSGRIELSLVRDVLSLREYPDIKDVWYMVARTAFTQLRLSFAWLAVTVAGMFVLFLAPALLPLFGSLNAVLIGMFSWLAMSALYLPTIRFYRLPLYWALALPAAAAIYLAATIDSARLYWQGKGGNWKGRTQA